MDISTDPLSRQHCLLKLSFTSQPVRQASEREGGNNFLIFLSSVEFMILASLSVCAIQGGSYGGRRDWRKDSFLLVR